MTDPRVVFCITCKDRAQHIKLTLKENMATNTHPNTRFVLLDYGSRDDLSHYLINHHMQNMESGRLIRYEYPTPGKFRMAHAKNMAHRCGLLEGADILVNLDADNYTGKDFDRWIIDNMAGSNRFLWARMLKGEMDRGISGRIAISREAFLCSGGYDEKYSEHSPDDKDLSARLCRLEYEPFEIDRKFLHAVRHGDKLRFKEYPHAINCGEDEMSIATDTRVVNNGRFGVGAVRRAWKCETIKLKPMPTRIFGIGMHKTATTSLHHAFETLGLRSGHWRSAAWAKRIYKETMAEGRSLTLEKCYALCDLPIPLLFPQLYAEYPGSKFILTLRDESEWVESVRKHWDGNYNQYRHNWKGDGFTNFIHERVYGQTTFDPVVMLRAYRRHNAQVLSFFGENGGKANDLLIMNMSQGDGWDRLCPFLDMPIPKEPYPVANKVKPLLKE